MYTTRGRTVTSDTLGYGLVTIPSSSTVYHKNIYQLE